MADFIGGGLPTMIPSAAAHSDPNASDESPAPITTLEPPASNPGSDDPSAGIAKDAGGTSNAAYIGSPVTQEHEEKTIVGTVLETVFGKKERSADEFESSTTASNTTNNNATVASTTGSEQATGAGAPGVLGAVAGAAAAGTAAVASYVGLSNTETTPKEEGDKTAAAVEKSTAETEAAASEKASEAVESTKEATTASTDDTKVEKVHPDTSHVGSDVGDKPKQVSDHEAANRENDAAIPTAGGEKLGTAHEGESKVIPDLPPQDPAADETKPGQPDQTTADNTAKNVGTATAPNAGTTATEQSPSGHGHKREESSSGKHKFVDRIKAKLHLDKKDKA